MIISKTSRYALQAATFLAEHFADDRCVRVGEIADGLDVPRNYLSKILHQLARAGVLNSVRGPKGGFRLAQSPADITLAQVIGPVEPALSDRLCLLGRPICSDDDPCAAHSHWQQLSADLTRFLDETTLADLVHHG